jgi:hypothetical protein
LRHAYDQVDPARIWEIATGDLPRMAAAAEAALQCIATRRRSRSEEGRGPSDHHGRSPALIAI